MIDLLHETVLSLADAARRLPPRRLGKRPHPATLFRWASRGLRDIRLEVIKVGDTTCTRVEALQRFFDQLTQKDHRLAEGTGPGLIANPNEDDIEEELDLNQANFSG